MVIILLRGRSSASFVGNILARRLSGASTAPVGQMGERIDLGVEVQACFRLDISAPDVVDMAMEGFVAFFFNLRRCPKSAFSLIPPGN